jgi:hypothetical protein
MFKALVCVLLVACVAAEVTQKDFYDFMVKHNKFYSTIAEHEYRFSVFKANMEKVATLNKEDPYATYGVTKFC